MPKRASRTESAVVVVVVRLGEVADRAVVALGAGCGAPIASPRLRIDMKFGTCSSSYFVDVLSDGRWFGSMPRTFQIGSA